MLNLTITAKASNNNIITTESITTDPTIDLFFEFTENTSNFEKDNITISGGELGELAKDGQNYTATLTPTEPNKPVTVHVAAGQFTSTSGNPNNASNIFTWTQYNQVSVDTMQLEIEASEVDELAGLAAEAVALELSEALALIEELQQPNLPTVNIPTADICFPAGTPVISDQGVIAIEKLIPGTHTIDEQPIVGISQTRSPDNHLLCFEKHALGHNIPAQQTIMSREHCILYKGKMKRACTFMRYARIRKVKYAGEALYNVMLEKPGSMSVNNMTVETLHPKNKAFCLTLRKVD